MDSGFSSNANEESRNGGEKCEELISFFTKISFIFCNSACLSLDESNRW
jgi:hypothetical protein